MFRPLLFAAALLMFWPGDLPAGGGKAAYRNYYLGCYYFAEANYQRAHNHLNRAWRLNQEQYVFTIALAIAKARTGDDFTALELLRRSANQLDPTRTDYAAQLALRPYLAGLIHLYAKRYYRAIPFFKEAIEAQLPLRDHRRIATIYNALGYAEMMDQGRGQGAAHNGLPPHYHIHRRDLERGILRFEEALRWDPTHPAAAANYQRMCDSLGLTPRPLALEKRDAAPRRIVSPKYDKLPLSMEQLQTFGSFDEVVYLLDISGSMVKEQVDCLAADRFSVMRQTAQYFLENLAPDTRIGIGTIGGDCGTEPELWHPAGSIDREEMTWTLRFLVPDGTTPLLTILQRTPELFSTAPGATRSLFFVSDGENICNLPGGDICEWAAELRRRGIVVNIMTFLGTNLNNASAFAEYTCLAEVTGGRIIYLDENRCTLEPYRFDLVDNLQLEVPDLQRVDCWGPSVEYLWATFPE
jgi:hypothetical protein